MLQRMRGAGVPLCVLENVLRNVTMAALCQRRRNRVSGAVK
jgi:hypothetical protein